LDKMTQPDDQALAQYYEDLAGKAEAESNWSNQSSTSNPTTTPTTQTEQTVTVACSVDISTLVPDGTDEGWNVLVSDLMNNSTEDEVREAFSDCGEITYLNVFRDKGSPTNCKGYAVIHFKSEDSQTKAVGQTGKLVKGHPMRVKIMEKKNTLFVGSIPKILSGEQVISALKQLCIPVTQDLQVELKVGPPPQNESRGFAFVTFSSHPLAEICKKIFGASTINGRPLHVSWADMTATIPVDEDTMSKVTTLYVHGLSADLQEDVLNLLFSQFGEVSKVSIIKSPHTGESKGFGFVTFQERDPTVKALEAMHDTLFMGNKLQIMFAKPQHMQSSTHEGSAASRKNHSGGGGGGNHHGGGGSGSSGRSGFNNGRTGGRMGGRSGGGGGGNNNNQQQQSNPWQQGGYQNQGGGFRGGRGPGPAGHTAGGGYDVSAAAAGWGNYGAWNQGGYDQNAWNQGYNQGYNQPYNQQQYNQQYNQQAAAVAAAAAAGYGQQQYGYNAQGGYGAQPNPWAQQGGYNQGGYYQVPPHASHAPTTVVVGGGAPYAQNAWGGVASSNLAVAAATHGSQQDHHYPAPTHSSAFPPTRVSNHMIKNSHGDKKSGFQNPVPKAKK